MVNEEIKAILEIEHHRALVQVNLLQIADALRERAMLHDISKYNFDEFQSIVKIKTIARQFPYGSPEYEQGIKDNQEGLDKHLKRNRHHPEYHPNGVSDMGLIDLIEMICDWKAANRVRDDMRWNEATEVHIKRFNLTPQQIWLINLIIKELADV